MSPPIWLLGLVLVTSTGFCSGGRHARQDLIHLIPPEEQPSTPPNESSRPAALPETRQPTTRPTIPERGAREPPTCPVNPDNLAVFLRMGHMGGGTRQHCENTLESARAGFAKGLNSFELDLCMSSDGVPFLWHDCDPSEFTARMRRFGKYLVKNTCLPYRHPSVRNRAPSQLTVSEIRRNFGYKRTWYKNDRIAEIFVPTLREFLTEFGPNPSVKRFYLDVKVPEASFPLLVNNTLAIAKELNIEHKLLISFPTPDKVRSAQAQLPIFTRPNGTQARLLLGLGIDPEDILVCNSYQAHLASAEKILSGLSRKYSLGYFDRLKVKYHLGMIALKTHGCAILSARSIYSRLKKKLVPVTEVQRLCIPYFSFRYSDQLPSFFGERFYKFMIRKIITERQSSGYPVKIISSNINGKGLAQWLRQAGVDGIMTDCPTILWP